MIDFEELRKDLERRVGFPVYRDYGSLAESYRAGNVVVHPVCAVFRMDPMMVTAIPRPFIGITSAQLETVTTPDTVRDTELALNTVAARASGTSIYLEGNDGKTYSVTLQVQTAAVGEKTDVKWYHGDIIPIRQTITYTISEDGLPSSEVKLKINGEDVPFLSMQETRAAASSSLTDTTGTAKTATEAVAHGVDFTVPALVKDPACVLIGQAFFNRESDHALCVEISSPVGTIFRKMSIANASRSTQPPQNVGVNVSLVEVSDSSAVYTERWSKTRVTGNYASVETASESVVFWGDGTAEKNPTAPHFYTDGKTSHDVYAFSLESGSRSLSVGDDLGGFPVYVEEDFIPDGLPDGFEFVKTSTGEEIYMNSGRICLKHRTNSGFVVHAIDTNINGKYGFKGKSDIMLPALGEIDTITGITLKYDPGKKVVEL